MSSGGYNLAVLLGGITARPNKFSSMFKPPVRGTENSWQTTASAVGALVIASGLHITEPIRSDPETGYVFRLLSTEYGVFDRSSRATSFSAHL